MESISKLKDTISSLEVKTLYNTLYGTEFVITILCLSDILSCTLPLSHFYKKMNIFDFENFQYILNDTIAVLNKNRQNCENYFTNFLIKQKQLKKKWTIH